MKPPKEKHWTFGQVKDTFQTVVRDGKPPKGFKCTFKEQLVIERFCSFMLERTTGREA